MPKLRTPLALAVLLALATNVGAEPGYIVDTHVHLDPMDDVHAGVSAAIATMDRFHIRRIVLMSPPRPPNRPFRYDIETLLFAAEKYPGRISLAGGGGTLNATIQATAPGAVTDGVKQKFRAAANEILAKGAVGFGEIAIQHLSLSPMGPNHPYESVAADHPLLLTLADIAAASQRPIDLHIDLTPEDMALPPRPIFNPTNPSKLKANLPAFERLLDHNGAAKIIWAHAGTDPLGTRTPAIERELLERHANLYMSLRVGRTGPAPTFALDDGAHLKPVWLALIRDFPGRFVLGSDLFYGGTRGPGEQELKNFWQLLCELPSDLAERIAHRNAEELYRLPQTVDAGAAGGGCAGAPVK